MKTHSNYIKVSLAISTVALAFAISPANAQDHDIVILNGRVMDPETKFDGVRNVGIKDGKIAKITQDKIKGKESIDATGHIVCPGFIDTHNHGCVTPHGVKLSLRTGVTTSMDLEMGAMNIADWYAERDGKWQNNYGATVGQEFARGIILDKYPKEKLRDMRDFTPFRSTTGAKGKWSKKIASPDEFNAILKLLDEGLMEGALGVGSLAGYASEGITTREMFETQKLAGKYGRLTAVHFRFLSPRPPTENSLGAAEVLANAVVLEAPVLLCHFNADNWPLVQELLVRARKVGVNAWGEVYPYASGSTSVGADFFEPENWKKKFGPVEETVLNPLTGKYLSEAELVKMRKEKPGEIVVGFIRPKEWALPWMKLPGVTLAGDAMLAVDAKGKELAWDDPYEKGAYHPRTTGTHGKALRLARENNIPWMHMISITSFNSAKHLGDAGLVSMKIRGRIQEGMVADITVFDPKTVQEKSDYAPGKNGFPPIGIPHVIVNGVVVVKDSKVLKGVTPGQEIRYPAVKKSRFTPYLHSGDAALKKGFPH
jgi:hypothetical protein